MQDNRRLPYLKGRMAQPTQEQTQPPVTQPAQPQFAGNQPQRPEYEYQNFGYQQPQPQQLQQPQLPVNQPQPPKLDSRPPSTQQSGPNPQDAQRTVAKKQSRIDTEQIPRPIIKSEDSVTYQIFKTSPQPIYHPPISSQYFIQEDDGNVGPRYMRASVYAIGNEASITNQTELPMGVIVQPLADPGTYEEPLPLTDFQGEPVRCTRCKAYINPYVQFTDNGNAFICNICRQINKTPADYYAPLGAGNIRGDKYEKPELSKGAYEIVAPPEYIKKPIENILIMFCIELTHQTVQMGVFQQILQSIQAILESIPCPERTDVAIVTFDQRMHFYNIPTNLASEPQIIVVSELDEINMPLPKEKLFNNVQNDKEKINYLIEKLQKQVETIGQNKALGVPLGAMLNNAANIMAPRSGRILMFTHQFPTIGMGKLQQRRVDLKILGTENEKTLYTPQDQTYVNLGKFCHQHHIAVDLWLFNENGHDLASIAPVSNITGGSIYFYPVYDPVVNGEELHYALFRNLTRTYAFDSVMTLRLSTGLTLYDYSTGQGKISIRDLDMASIDSDKSIAIYFKHEDKIDSTEAYLQYALLYTSVYGQRLIRVFNLQLQVSSKTGGNNPWHTMFKTSDVDAVLQLMARKHLGSITQLSTKVIRQNIFQELVNLLHAYRKYCSSTSPHGQLILPETIKTLPLFIQSIYKREALRQGQIRVDNRIFEIHLLMTQTSQFVANFLFPKIYPIHTIQESLVLDQFQFGTRVEDLKVVMPPNIPATMEKLRSDGLYLIDIATYIYFFVSRGVSQELLIDIFQVSTIEEVEQIEQLPITGTEQNTNVHNIIDQIRRNKNGTYQPIKIVVQNTLAAQAIASWLVEDEFRQEKSYGDFLCDIHAAIQAKGI